jgi:hypothetical protein
MNGAPADALFHFWWWCWCWVWLSSLNGSHFQMAATDEEVASSSEKEKEK